MSAYQPKTGAKCGCRRGVQRDNCPHCEGTGMVIDFKAMRARGGEAMTHTATHTPGPWVVRNRDAVYAQSGRFIADCELTPYGSRPQPPNSIDEANAHLIAAAPAMYEALQTAYKLLREWTPSGEDNQGEVEGLIESALAQAEGKQ